jgi:hypothetical protein
MHPADGRRRAARRASSDQRSAMDPRRRRGAPGPQAATARPQSLTRSSLPGSGRQGRCGGRRGTACGTSRCGGPSRRSGRGKPEPLACSGCLMSPCGCRTVSQRPPGMPGPRPASRRSDDGSCRQEAHGPTMCPLREVRGARGEGQADRCRVWSGLVCGVPAARVLVPVGVSGVPPTVPGAAGARGSGYLRATCAG